MGSELWSSGFREGSLEVENVSEWACLLGTLEKRIPEPKDSKVQGPAGQGSGCSSLEQDQKELQFIKTGYGKHLLFII